ncbi:MAG: UDP-N-acetylmuramoyl-L-alanine--D-glutamate ligase [Rudaea sp.]|uniref:UDP-N-acetylmuramoyl-L-alanine--D-glutamate ligase n=1 Tax=Rudaea sp. TaxID=2136325 RepID=UPI0039E618D4
MRLADLEHKRVAVWGCGREGRAALAVLRRRFPRQHVTLFCSEAEAAALVADARVSFRSANASDKPNILVVTTPVDEAALAAFDIVIKSPGISPYREPYCTAENAGVRFTSGTALWFGERSQARTICITGTKGKSTVSALIAHLLRAGGRLTALAGNIGMPLLDLLDVAAEPDWWVIELSSFQTRDFDGAPTVAVINNLYEEHLDWHVNGANYAADKLRIAARAKRLVINAGQKRLVAMTQGDLADSFNQVSGWHMRDGELWRADRRVLARGEIPLPGTHNALNVCAALAAIEAASEDAVSSAPFVASFKGLPHRLQYLGERDGIDYVNDSISTTPYAAIEALRSVGERRSTILVGGFDRGVDWTPFVEHVGRHPPHAVVTLGANGDAIAARLEALKTPVALASTDSLAAAVGRARSLTETGGAIVLSPGAPSFDQFSDYAERGREFARLAGFDPTAIAAIEGLGIA